MAIKTDPLILVNTGGMKNPLAGFGAGERVCLATAIAGELLRKAPTCSPIAATICEATRGINTSGAIDLCALC